MLYYLLEGEMHNQVFRLIKPGKFELCDEELTDRPDNWVTIRFRYCAICGTDMSSFWGRRLSTDSLSLGHEFIAQVEEPGEWSGKLSQDDWVTSDFNIRCGACEYCARNESHLCINSNIYRFSNRAFATRAHVRGDCLYKLPPRENMIPFSLVEPLSCVLHAMEDLPFNDHNPILVVGLGGLGLCMAFALAHHPNRPSFDCFELMESRKQLMSLALKGTRGWILDTPKDYYPIVFDLTGTHHGLSFACDHVRPGGKLISLSHIDEVDLTSFLYPKLMRGDVWFKISYENGPLSNIFTAISMINDNWNGSWDKLICVNPKENLNNIFNGRKYTPFLKDIIEL